MNWKKQAEKAVTSKVLFTFLERSFAQSKRQLKFLSFKEKLHMVNCLISDDPLGIEKVYVSGCDNYSLSGHQRKIGLMSAYERVN